ncbi:hypothetical protein AB6A40_006999 [Gnathostoma spinigerum]|uniref:ATP synthase subunit s, mitochondrial n=1 Tax=Gnathostoma spinigerum TaxID=75299 RepID=A0ABD6EL65_9BILA
MPACSDVRLRWFIIDRFVKALGRHDLPGLRGLLEGFNYYDRARVKEVGADRAAAEWIVRCEGEIKFDKFKKYISDYNKLIKETADIDPRVPSEQVHLVSINACDASITGYGCRHFAGLHHLIDVRFIRCRNLHDYGLEYMCDAVAKSLKYLQIESCPRITEFGLEHLTKLTNLESLILHDLHRVHGQDDVRKLLNSALPKCNIQYS